MLCPNIEITADMVLPKIDFSGEIGDREKDILESVIRDFKKDLSPEDKEYLDNKVKDLTGSQDQNLDTLFPSQEKFLGDLLFYWAGSRKLSGTPYHFMYRSGMTLLEAHTCFNQLITGDLDNTKDFLERFLVSNLMGGTAFGIAGRRQTMKKKRKISPQVFKKYLNSRLSLPQRKPSFKTMSTVVGKTRKLFKKQQQKRKKKQPRRKNVQS